MTARFHADTRQHRQDFAGARYCGGNTITEQQNWAEVPLVEGTQRDFVNELWAFG